MRNLLSAALKFSLVLSVLVLVPACNTVEGAGKDVKEAGKGLENAADNNK